MNVSFSISQTIYQTIFKLQIFIFHIYSLKLATWVPVLTPSLTNPVALAKWLSLCLTYLEKGLVNSPYLTALSWGLKKCWQDSRLQSGHFLLFSQICRRGLKSLYVHVKSVQLCPTLCDPVGCNPPVCSVHGIFCLCARQLIQVFLKKCESSFVICTCLVTLRVYNKCYRLIFKGW